MNLHKYKTSPWRVFKHPSLLLHGFLWRDLKYQISAWFNPRQKWLTKTIPNTWCDKVELIPHLLFACIINYVEDEKGLQDNVDWDADIAKGYVTQEYVDNRNQIYSELREVYNYVKTERPQLEDKHDNSYPTSKEEDFFYETEDGKFIMRSCEDLYGMSFKEAYADTDRLQKLIEEKDMWAMNTIIKHHQYMWT